MRKQLAAALVVVPVLWACSSKADPEVSVQQAGDESTTTTKSESTTTSSEAPKASDAAEAYMKALATGTPEGMEAMRQHSAEGSAARLYADHQINGALASRSAGYPTVDQSVNVKPDGSVEACFNNIGDRICNTFANFVADPANLLTTFTVDGKPIDERLLRPSGETATAQGATARVLSGYKTATSGAYLIMVEIKAGSKAVSVYSYSASYVDPSGSQYTADTTYSSSPSGDIQPGASVVISVGFPGANPGGRLILEIADPVSYDTSEISLSA